MIGDHILAYLGNGIGAGRPERLAFGNREIVFLNLTIDLGRGIRFGPSAFVTDEINYSLSESRKLDFLQSIQSYWPSVQGEDLIPGYSGVRPKLEGVEDFIIDAGSVGSAQHVNILGYASPGLTSSLALAMLCNSSALAASSLAH